MSGTRTNDTLAANGRASELAALTEGFRSAVLACGLIAAVGAVAALALLGRPKTVFDEELEPAAGTTPD